MEGRGGPDAWAAERERVELGRLAPLRPATHSLTPLFKSSPMGRDPLGTPVRSQRAVSGCVFGDSRSTSTSQVSKF